MVKKRGVQKHWTGFCKGLREAIIDERKARHEYAELIKHADQLELSEVMEILREIASDESDHNEKLTALFGKICPRMAFHRKGL